MGLVGFGGWGLGSNLGFRVSCTALVHLQSQNVQAKGPPGPRRLKSERLGISKVRMARRFRVKCSGFRFQCSGLTVWGSGLTW